MTAYYSTCTNLTSYKQQRATTPAEKTPIVENLQELEKVKKEKADLERIVVAKEKQIAALL